MNDYLKIFVILNLILLFLFNMLLLKIDFIYVINEMIGNQYYLIY